MLRRFSQLSLSAWIFVGLGLGVLFGLFLGELCRPLNFVGKAFIMLLQMGVFPYMVVTLIQGVGSLSPGDAKLMAGRGSLMLVLFWAVGLVAIFAFTYAFPVSQSSSFFSVSEPHPVEAVNLLEYYIPANIFDALSDALVPAIVFFSVFLGIALLRVQNREPFLNMLSGTGSSPHSNDQNGNKDIPNWCLRSHSDVRGDHFFRATSAPSGLLCLLHSRDPCVDILVAAYACYVFLSIHIQRSSQFF